MKNENLLDKIDEFLLRIAYMQNNVSMAAEVFDSIKSKKSDSVERSKLKLYDFERIGNRVETTFNYIDSELNFLFDELNACLKINE